MTEKIISPAKVEGLPFNIELTGTSYCDGGYYIFRKSSDVTRIEYIISGTGTVKCDSRVVFPEKGDMYILPVGTRHEYYSSADDPWTKIWINVKGRLSEELLSSYGLNNRILFKNCAGIRYIQEIQEICNNKKASSYEIQSFSAVTFLRLIQFINENCNIEEKFSPASFIKEYIDRHAFREITVNMLADLISRSVSQTIRIFKNKYNMTPYEYLIYVRMESAKSMLRNTNIKVKDIAIKTGFNDENYFILLFRKKTGSTPLQYRKMQN